MSIYDRKCPLQTRRLQPDFRVIRLAILAAAAVWGGFAVRGIARAARPLTWSSTTGEITSSLSDQVFVGITVGRYSNRPTFETHYHVKYRYVITGVEYTGTRINEFGSPERTYALTGERRFPIGAKIPVRYNSRNPAESVLEVTFPWSWIATLIAVVALCWFALSPLAWSGTRLYGSVRVTPA